MSNCAFILIAVIETYCLVCFYFIWVLFVINKRNFLIVNTEISKNAWDVMVLRNTPSLLRLMDWHKAWSHDASTITRSSDSTTTTESSCWARLFPMWMLLQRSLNSSKILNPTAQKIYQPAQSEKFVQIKFENILFRLLRDTVKREISAPSAMAITWTDIQNFALLVQWLQKLGWKRGTWIAWEAD